MLNIKHEITVLLLAHLERNFQISLDIEGLIEVPPKPELGDYALPCFQLAKTLRKSPQQIAAEIAQSIKPNHIISRVTNVGPYVNFFVNKTTLAREVLTAVFDLQDNYGSSTRGRGKTIVLDYSSPNVAKPFHVGHLRTTIIGSALYKIYSHLGFRCIGINHLGDWGTQFGKLILAYKLWGDKETVESDPINQLVRLYVRFHQEAEDDPELEQEARRWFAKLESGDSEALELWQWFVDVSIKEFEKMYRILDVHFDHYLGESFYISKVPELVEALREKGLLVESEGALVVPLGQFDMPPCIILKSDGTSIYTSRDIAAAIYRKKTYNFDQALYVTDYAQNLHFKQWIKVLELMGYEWSKNIKHISYGRVRLREGKMQTRTGSVILLKDVIEEAVNRACKIIAERNPHLPNREEVAMQVGIGAIIYNDLYHNRMNDVVFDWDAMLSFEGESGPYLQYTYARSCRVLEKAHEELTADIDFGLLVEPEAIAVIKELYDFPAAVERAAAEYEPSIITRHLTALAQHFNRFYHQHQIIVDDHPDLQRARLLLCFAVNKTLGIGMRLLGIPAPKRM